MKLVSLAISSVTVCVLMASQLPPAGGAPPPEAAAEPTTGAPTVVRGSVPDGATVTAYARTNAPLQVGDEVASLELPVVVNEATSQFAVKADARALPDQYLSEADVIDVQVVAAGPEGALWADHVSAKAVRTDSGLRWTSPLAATTPAGAFARPTSDRYGTDGVDVGSLADLGQPPATAGRQGENCSTTVINSHWVKAQIGATFPVGRSRGWLGVRHSGGGRYQVAMKVPNHPMQKVEMMHADGGWALTTPRVRGTRRYITTVKYLVVDNKFRAPDGTCQYYLTWEPKKESGGMRLRDGRRPNYGHCVPMASGIEWSRHLDSGSPYRLSLGVNAGWMVGFDLAVEKNYGDSTHTLNYKIRGRKVLCGSNDTPATASIVMEKRRG